MLIIALIHCQLSHDSNGIRHFIHQFAINLIAVYL